MHLPCGTVTFLFTDIEGSTQLWEQHPQPMRLALSRHDALLREAIQTHNGQVFKTVGDAFYAVFAAADALAGALAAQLALHAGPWPEEVGMLRVRMALHTGNAEEQDGDYFGPPLNRVARLMAVGHGGQVLLSQITRDRIGDALPEGCAFQDMRAHRLKDLQQPEHIYQLLHPALPSDFPPLRSLQAFANNLPVQPTSFIGREREIAEIKNLLLTTRLLTLTGIGGAGKTRLSLQVAAEVLEEYPDGVWLVELAALSDPALVPQAIAWALNLRDERGRPITQTLTDYLQSKTLLLVLDNCEHLIEACAKSAELLMKACPSLKILATSREALNISGETLWRIPSLSLPNPRQWSEQDARRRSAQDSASHPASTVLEYEAVKLFVDRATASLPGFTMTETNAGALAQVCHRLDGIPLAIELAAARVRVMPVEEITKRLDDRFRLLVGGNRAALPRQQTLRALIDWSYDLLNAQERLLLRRLSVFAGGWTLAAAEQICAGEGLEAWEVLTLLGALVDKSLVVFETQTDGEARYRMLETVRQYGREHLMASEELERLRTGHRDFFLQWARETTLKLHGPDQKLWLDRLETEHDNLRTALEWCRADPDGAETELRLAWALGEFWTIRGYWHEGRSCCTMALAREGAQESTQARANVLQRAGVLAQYHGDYAAAKAWHEAGLAIYRQIGNKQGIASALSSLGNVIGSQGDYVTARSLYEEGLALQRELGNQMGTAITLGNLGIALKNQGDYAGARALYAESLVIFRQVGNKQGIANTLNNLGNVLHFQGDYDAAQTLHVESLALRREIGDKRGIATSLSNIGSVAKDQKDYAKAQVYLEECLALMREVGDRRGTLIALNELGDLTLACPEPDCVRARAYLVEGLHLSRDIDDKLHATTALEGSTWLAVMQKQWIRATRLCAAADAIYASIGAARSPGAYRWFESILAELRVALGEELFVATWAEGQAMTFEQAIAYALSEE
jgi:predicted ATPase/class 3 adenylate cyclase